jgi:glutathione S-transferase
VSLDFSGLPSIAQYPEISKWFENLLQRPGFEAGRNVPRPHFHITLNNLPEDELDKFAEPGKKWQKEAREREAAL